MKLDNLNNCERLEKVLEDLQEVYEQLLDEVKDNRGMDNIDRIYQKGYYSGGLNILERIAHQLNYFPITEVKNESIT